MSYRNEANIGASNISVSIYDTNKVLSDDDIALPTSENTFVEATRGRVLAEVKNIEQLDENGNATDSLVLSRYADISIKPPSVPINLLVYVRAEFKGFVFWGFRV